MDKEIYNNLSVFRAFFVGLWLISFKICSGYQIQGDGPMCFACDDTIYPRSCAFVKRCQFEEAVGTDTINLSPFSYITKTCYVKKLQRSTGTEYYETGCNNSSMCAAPRSSDEQCFQCCHGDFCNVDLCNAPSYPDRQVRGPVCFSCDQHLSPTSCDKITLCSRDQVCHIEETFALSDRVYSTGCVPSIQCKATSASAVGKRSSRCFRCCNDDFCNNNCHDEAPPLSITIEANVGHLDMVPMHSTVQVKCLATGRPQPTVSWMFLSSFATLPSNTKVSLVYGGSVLTITDVQTFNTGRYRCSATNDHGSTYKEFDIQTS